MNSIITNDPKFQRFPKGLLLNSFDNSIVTNEQKFKNQSFSSVFFDFKAIGASFEKIGSLVIEI